MAHQHSSPSSMKCSHCAPLSNQGDGCRVELDEDVPGAGKHYCISCSKYFIDNKALTLHHKSKPHKRRVAELVKLKEAGIAPHSSADAERAACMGRTDNGPKLRSHLAVAPMIP
jgi:hypothetical protein